MNAFAVLFSQEEKLISGALQLEYDNSDYENIIFTNLRNGKTATSNILGQFQIEAVAGDLIEAKGINIFTKEFEISQDNYNRGEILVLLEPLVIPLSGLEVSSFQFTGNLEYDTKRIKIKDELAEAIAKMGIPMGKKVDEIVHLTEPVYSLKNPLSLNIGALNEVITGERKKKLALYYYNKKRDLVSNIRKFYTDELFTETLGIPLEEIDPYLFTLIEISDIQTYFNAKDYYSSLQILKEFSPVFKERLRLRDALK